VDSGFSIVKYTGNGTNGATIGHGLSSAPELVLIKQLSTAGHHWKSIAAVLGAGKAIYLNLDIAAASGQFNNTLPTDDVFTLDTDTNDNENNASHIAYCFHSISGYQKVGSYSGGTSGYEVTLDFTPRFVMIKNATNAGGWVIVDSQRGSNELYPHISNAEDTTTTNVVLGTNKFTLNTTGSWYNASGSTYIYLAIA